MFRALAIVLAALPAGAIAQSSPLPDTRGLWLDWRQINAASLEAEEQRRAPAPRTAEQAQKLGERVGELVATGDCVGGERMAQEAGDLPLVEAVRRYCRGPNRRR